MTHCQDSTAWRPARMCGDLRTACPSLGMCVPHPTPRWRDPNTPDFAPIVPLPVRCSTLRCRIFLHAVVKEKIVPYLLEAKLKELGGQYESSSEKWAPHAVRDGNLVTGGDSQVGKASRMPSSQAKAAILREHGPFMQQGMYGGRSFETAHGQSQLLSQPRLVPFPF